MEVVLAAPLARAALHAFLRQKVSEGFLPLLGASSIWTHTINPAYGDRREGLIQVACMPRLKQQPPRGILNYNTFFCFASETYPIRCTSKFDAIRPG